MFIRIVSFISAFILIASCAKDRGASPLRQPDTTYSPELAAQDFLPNGTITNPYFPFEKHKTYVYRGKSEEGDEYMELTRSSELITILGITCSIFVEEVKAGGVLVEQEKEYYAEDLAGNVWTLGAAVNNYNSTGDIINNHTSWIAGVDGAKPGIAMLAQPQVGNTHRVEYYFNVTEDQMEVIETGKTVTTSLGTFQNCIVILEWSDLEPDLLEYETYAPAVGLIKEVNIVNGDELQLIDIN